MKKNIKVFLVCMIAVLMLTALTACNPDPTPTNPTECAHQGGEATCLEPAVCALCGEFYGEAKGHSYGEWTVKTAATCDAAGEEVRTCSCGAAETRELAATGHSFGQWSVKTAATCDAAGEETRSCSCGAVETRELAATGHSFGQWSVKTAATCEAAGEETRTCSCGAVETRAIAATGHSYGEWTVKTAATCEAAGEETRSCSCGEVEQRQIAALGHDYEATYVWSEDYLTCTASATCKRDEAHTASETAKIGAVKLNVTAEQVTYVYTAVFENADLEAQSRSVEATVAAENGLVTVTAPAISGLVPSHDYVKFSFRGGETSHSFTVYYSEIDVWDGKTVSTSLSGKGTEAEPYLIQSAADFAYFAGQLNAAAVGQTENFKGQYYKMTRSIDLGGNLLIAGNHSGWNKYQGFGGIFDGNNCTIRGINVAPTTGTSSALFGCITKSGALKNLNVYGNAKGAATVGGVVAYQLGKVDNVTSYVTVNATAGTIGGVVANQEGSAGALSNCVNYGDVTSTSYIVGGVVGSGGATITDCVNWGNVKAGNEAAGGVIGTTKDKGTISGCVNYGSVKTTATDKGQVGGIVGKCVKPVSGCYNYGTVTGANTTGGIAGSATKPITDCANYGAVIGIKCSGFGIGQIAGSDEAVVTDCAENGTVTIPAHTMTHYEAKAATCYEDGNVEYWHCSSCDQNLDADGKVIAEDVVIPATEHSYGEQTVTVAPTCETNGWAACECSCGVVQMVVIPAWGHNYGEATYTWAEDGSACTASVTCPNGTPHIIEENAAIVISMEVSADKVICTYQAVFENDYFETQAGKTEELTATVANGIMTVTAPAIPGLVPSHDYVKFDFHNEEATYTFDIYYSEVDVWNGESVSESLSGSGTEADPYLIQSAADFAYFASQINAVEGAAGVNYKVHTFKGQYFKLTKSIDLNGHDLMAGMHAGWNNYQCFAGIFDGNNRSIRGLNISRTDSSAALFGCVQKGGAIKNFTLYGSVKGNTTVGSAVAYLLGTAENITSYVTVEGTSTVGGVIANAENKSSEVIGCVNYGTVTGSSFIVGGITGSGGHNITDCVNHGIITGTDVIGGITGTTKDTGSISGCYNYGTVNASGKSGGIVGNIMKPITNCVNYGDVNGTWALGGIAGYVEKSKSTSISNCTNYGNVNGSSTGNGGILGLSEPTAGTVAISDCINNGDVTASWGGGGIAGDTKGAVSGCTNNGNVSGEGQLGGIVGKAGGTVTGCTNNGAITASVNIVGGICGEATAEIADCVNAGKVTLTNCGETMIDGITPSNVTKTNCENTGTVEPKPHTMTHYEAKAATCEEAGNVEYWHCSDCNRNFDAEGNVLETVEIPALNHDYEEVTYTWSDDYSTCTALLVCKNGHEASETATVTTVALNVTADKVTYTYGVAFEGQDFEAQTKIIEGEVALANNIATVNAPVIANRVASHDYVKFGFHDAEATYTFTIYYSEIDVWDGKTVSTSLSGSGTAEDPYLIQSGADLAYLKSVIDATAGGSGANYKVKNFAGQYFKMTKSIDLNGADFMIGYHKGWNEYEAFCGHLDGNNCTIRGLNVNPANSGSSALFACVSNGGSIKNLSLYGKVTGASTVGTLVGYLVHKNSTVENVTNFATINATGGTIGGIVANQENSDASTLLKNCVNYGDVTSTSYIVGGVVGSGGATITDCVNWGNVTGGDESIGGIAGTTKNAGTISGCVNYGSVKTTATDKGQVGGIVGKCVKPVSGCYNYGTVTGANTTGGIAGSATKPITDCANYGAVIGIKCSSFGIGQIAGSDEAVVTDCTENGSVTIKEHEMTHYEAKSENCVEDGNVEYWFCANCKKNYSAEDGGNVIANVVIPKTGHNYDDGVLSEDGSKLIFTCQNAGCGDSYEEDAYYTVTVKHLYLDGTAAADTETTKYIYNSIQTINAKTVTGYVASHDYVKVHVLGDQEITIYYSEVDVWDGTGTWDGTANVATSLDSLGGTGTQTDPYIIDEAQDLVTIANIVNSLSGGGSSALIKDKYFKMTKSIDLNNKPLYIGGYSGWSDRRIFDGHLDGNNCSIRGLNNDRALFGCIEGSARNLSLYGEISATATNGASLVAYLRGQVHYITNYANVTGFKQVGGLIANIENKSNPSTHLTNYGKVTSVSNSGAWSAVGGVIGCLAYNHSDMVNWGDIICDGTQAGGIAGYGHSSRAGTLTNAYNYGTVYCSASATGQIIGGIGKHTLSNCYEYGQVVAVLPVTEE